jgi:hypothetical protein
MILVLYDVIQNNHYFYFYLNNYKVIRVYIWFKQSPESAESQNPWAIREWSGGGRGPPPDPPLFGPPGQALRPSDLVIVPINDLKPSAQCF